MFSSSFFRIILSNFIYFCYNNPDSKVHGANMGPTRALLAPDGPHEPCYLGMQMHVYNGHKYSMNDNHACFHEECGIACKIIYSMA